MNLKNGSYKPFRKPGDKPLYISSSSNHPPLIIKNIPGGIERRLNYNSSSEEIFKEAAPMYQAELDRCGYKHKLEYYPKTVGEFGKERKRKGRSASRRITWFHPPYSMDVAPWEGSSFY